MYDTQSIELATRGFSSRILDRSVLYAPKNWSDQEIREGLNTTNTVIAVEGVERSDSTTVYLAIHTKDGCTKDVFCYTPSKSLILSVVQYLRYSTTDFSSIFGKADNSELAKGFDLNVWADFWAKRRTPTVSNPDNRSIYKRPERRGVK